MAPYRKNAYNPRVQMIMRRLFALLLAGCVPLPPPASSPQPSVVPEWRNLQRLPTSSRLRAVRFVSATTGWVAGDATSLFATTDGGATWTQQEHSPRNRGGDVAALDAFGTLVHAVGTDGSVGRVWGTSDDAGYWTTQDADATGYASLNGVDLTSATTGYAIASDGTVRKFAGNAITSHSLGDAGPWNSIHFPSGNTIGFACGAGGKISKSIDAGLSWTLIHSGVVGDLRRIHMVDDLRGFAVGDNDAVLQTIDGTNWNPLSIQTGVPWRGVHFPEDALTGWVVGDGGRIYSTANGGVSWTAQSSGLTFDLYDVWFIDNQRGWIVGDYGTVLRTSDGGHHWSLLSQGSLASLAAVDFGDNGTVGYAVGSGGTILRSVDGGEHWTSSPSGVAVDLLGVSVPTTGTVAYACGAGGTILRTDNQGLSWSAQSIGTMTLRAILFPSSDAVGYCVGDGSTIRKTSNGTVWTSQASPVAADFYAVSAPFTGLTAYACGSSGKLIGTDDGGTLWVDVSPSLASGVLLQSLQSPTGATVYAGGSNGTIYRSLNGGVFWQAIGDGSMHQGLAFSSATAGWAVDGGIVFTQDSASTWARSYDHTRHSLRAIWVGADGFGRVSVGDFGTVLKYAYGL